MLRTVKSAVLSNEVQPCGIRLGPFSGLKIFEAPANSLQIRYGLWERETYRYIKQAARHASWVIDIGTGNGELALFFALKTECSPIIAVDPTTHQIAARNFTLNKANRVRLLDCYLGTADGQIRLDALPVDATKPGFIKLDADFAELDILRSGDKLLRQKNCDLLVETHSAALERDCSAYLASLGYRITIIPNAWWRSIIPEQRSLDHNRWLWASTYSDFD